MFNGFNFLKTVSNPGITQPLFGKKKSPFYDLISNTPDVPKEEEESPFLSKYRSLMGNRPMKDRYSQELMNDPQEDQYKPGKIQKLAAVLSGASAGYKDPTQGYALTRKILDTPYDDAKLEHQNKLKNMAQSVDLENDSINQGLKALEYEDSDKKYRTSLSNDKRDFDERKRLNDASIKNQEIDNDRANWETYVNEETGHRIRHNTKTNEIQDLGKIKTTKSEDDAADLDKFKKTDDYRTGNDKKIKQIEFDNEGKLIEKRAKETRTTNSDRITANLDAAKERLKTRFSVDPKSTASTTFNELSRAIADDPDLERYVTFNKEKGMFIPDKPFSADEEKYNRVKAILSKAPEVKGTTKKEDDDPLSIGIKR